MQREQDNLSTGDLDGPLRRLPWPGDGGKPSFLSTNDGNGFVSRMADRVEAQQLDMGENLLAHVQETLRQGSLPEAEWRDVVTALSVALRDALRVAESRGDRLPQTGGRGDESPTTEAVVGRLGTRILNQEPGAVTWAREKAGLTKRALARRVGISEQLAGEIESGRRSATPANLARIAETLNCPMVFLERKRPDITEALAASPPDTGQVEAEPFQMPKESSHADPPQT